MQNLTLRASGAQTAASETATINTPSNFTDATFILDVTALATQTADHLDVYIDVTPDDGSTWLNAIHFTQQDGDGSAAKYVAKLSKGQLLNDPDAELVVTTDAAESVVRNLFVSGKIRYRGVVAESATDDASFTYSVTAIFE